ncbi:MAG: RNA polymerase sigma factor [Deltaproteobacteria bacterium]|nr:RNA polymerase sigma factor [Deltaproteobacteria bacterium]
MDAFPRQGKMGLAATTQFWDRPDFPLTPRAIIDVSTLLARPVLEPTPTPAEADPGRVIERCRTGDRAALGELYGLYKSEAMRFIRHAVRDGRDAEDILQEVFVEVAHSIRSFAGRSSFESWLRCVCVRTALRQLKRRTRQVGEESDDVDEKAERHLASSDDPSEGFERRERARRIGRLLEKIAPKKRMVLVLHDFEGVPPKEIAQMVGAPVLTVRTRLFYARKELAELAAQAPFLSQDLKPWLEAMEGAR